jgi:uncharacterized membrane protein YsdA (DUF1294 family)
VDSGSPAFWPLVIGAFVIVLTIRWSQHRIERRRSAAAEWHDAHALPYTVVGLMLAGGLAGWITTGFDQSVLLSWLLAVNLVAVVFYGWDKLAAKMAVTRVPERSLQLLAVAGGTVGAFVAQRVFHHKTSKTGFQFWFWIIVALQAAIVVAYARTRSTPS